ncbi:serine/threonine-protein phosphatase, partial [Gregarina niphandrodes]
MQLNDRQVPEVEAPPQHPLSPAILWPEGSDKKPDWKALRAHCLKEGRLSISDCLLLINRVTSILSAEPNLLTLQDPITVVGDIHGQYFDLIRLLEIGGDPDNDGVQYLFLGDYVDRGSFSIEVLLVLYALKLCHPRKIWLLRGNHECRQMTSFFNFRDECEYKYNLSVYEASMQSFDCLPLTAVLNDKFLALHGGISPQLID